MAEALRLFNGPSVDGTATRSAVSAADTAALDHATFLAVTKTRCAHADVAVTPSLNDSSATATIRVIWYDRNDEVIGVSDARSVAASTLENDSRFIGDTEIFSNSVGAYAARVRVTAVSASDTVSLFAGTVDKFASR